MKDFTNLSELIYFQNLEFNNKTCLNFKENGTWRSFSNQEFFEQSFYFACGLKEIGIKNHHTLAIFAYQGPIWLIVDFGIILAGAISVPMFPDIAQENLFYQLHDANVEFIFVDKKENFEILKEKNIQKIITYNFRTDGAIAFEDLILLGKNAVAEKKYNIDEFLKLSKPQDLVTIIYTSGSTGRPKGVELTHNNLVLQIKAAAIRFLLDKNVDRALSFLPLAHIFERMVMMFYITQGVSIYFVDDVKNLGNLLKEVRPSLMTVVPRMLEKVFIKIKEGVENSGFIKKIIAKKALQRALTKDVESKNIILDKFFDLIVYRKFRQGLGGNMRMIICGGAPLSQEMERFYKNIGINLYCGYGLTETAPVLAVNYKDNYKFATVGKVFPFVELKIASDGELLARGDNVMRGYHNASQKTAEVIENGWFKTGDLAQIDADGFVKIIGRKKELFKTANGKYVRPIPIEQKLVQELGFLVGALIIAEGRKFVSTLLFPDSDLLKKFKTRFNFLGSDEDFLKSDSLYKFVEKAIELINSSLDHAEQIRRFAIITQEISIENGGITPSMKLKRSFLEEKFHDVIAGFYRE